MAGPKIDAKMLEGLVYRAAEKREVIENGVKKQKSFPTARPLIVDDIMSSADAGSEIVIATKDGRKYRLAKAGKKGE